MTKSMLLGAMVTIVLAMGSCSTTTTTLSHVIKSDAYRGGRITKVLVIGVSKQPDVRKLFEDEFVEELKRRGINAVAGYSVIPYDKIADREYLVSNVRELGVDSVVVTRLLNTRTYQKYNQGQVSNIPLDYGSENTYYGYCAAGSSAECTAEEAIYLKTNVYDAKTEKLIWSGLSQTLVEGATPELIRSFVPVIVKRLYDDKIL